MSARGAFIRETWVVRLVGVFGSIRNGVSIRAETYSAIRVRIWERGYVAHEVSRRVVVDGEAKEWRDVEERSVALSAGEWAELLDMPAPESWTCPRGQVIRA